MMANQNLFFENVHKKIPAHTHQLTNSSSDVLITHPSVDGSHVDELQMFFADEYDDVLAMACAVAEAEHDSTPAPTPPTQIPRSTTRTEQSLRRGIFRRISPKYINSKVRKLDLKNGKPLPHRIMQLRRDLY